MYGGSTGLSYSDVFGITVASHEQHTPVEQSIANARKVSPLRQRMIDDMMVRNFAQNTMVCYLKQVSYFARHFGRSPDRLGPEEIRRYQIY